MIGKIGILSFAAHDELACTGQTLSFLGTIMTSDMYEKATGCCEGMIISCNACTL